MRPSTSPAALLLTFMLGACTTVALQSSASGPSEAEPAATDASASAPADESPTPTVVSLEDAPKATAPNGKGTITHLARGKNAYLGRLRMDAGGAVPVHRDPTEEYIHVLEGGGVMTIDGKQYEVGPGTTIYMPANVEVSYQNGDQEMVAVQVFAGPEPSAKYDSWTPVQ
jgi:quercetin dioxygenase-like cupin family protein